MLLPKRDVATGQMLPVDPTLASECDDYSTFTKSPSDEPAGLMPLSGKPSRVSVQILSGGALFYQGVVWPRYAEGVDDCSYDTYVELRPPADPVP
jgi:hypothetical protein